MKERIKHGYYTMYNGKEYGIARNSVSNTLELISYDDEDLQFGFVEITKRFKGVVPFILAKTISLDAIDNVYYIYTYAIYHGHDIAIESSTDNTVLLVSSDKIFYEKYGFEEVDRNVYMKDVPFDEVELVKECRPAEYVESVKDFV